MRCFVLFVLTCVVSTALQSQDSTGSLPDSLLVRVSTSGQAYLVLPTNEDMERTHLARLFSCSAQDILESWEDEFYDQAELRAVYYIPLELELQDSVRANSGNIIGVFYQVKPKETLFTIARRYFDLTIDQLQRMNGLDSTGLKIGQMLYIGSIDLRPAVSVDHLPPTDDTSRDSILPDPFMHASNVAHARGVALWDKAHPDTQHMFVMHRTARINSILEITNPMFGRKLPVKVIGRIPRTYRDDVLIIVSPGVARKLGAIDSRFYVYLRYIE